MKENYNELIKINRDGFVWRLISRATAEAIWYAGTDAVYILYNDDSESIVEQPTDLLLNDVQYGLEVGYLNYIE